MSEEEKDLAKVEMPINLPMLTMSRDAVQIVRENLEGIVLDFQRLTIPSGGGRSWDLPDTDTEETARAIQGVIIDHHPNNIYFSQPYSGEAPPPDCMSIDGKRGRALPNAETPAGEILPWAGETRNCADCPLNQFGSALNSAGEATRGKACANRHRVFIIPDGHMDPWEINLPTMSVRAFGDFIRAETNRAIKAAQTISKAPYYAWVVEVGLKQEKNRQGITYSQVTWKREDYLPDPAVQALKEQRDSILPLLRQIEIDPDTAREDWAEGDEDIDLF